MLPAAARLKSNTNAAATVRQHMLVQLMFIAKYGNEGEHRLKLVQHSQLRINTKITS